ncbi:hypothetical protein [Ferruginibacter sp. HRS2-29]|uniref:hypothetical protein n=1 Tax=Ferruginibacter sp. HRS2-29 TaxID=2487334 RepID=UPI0020CFCC26|nr:hypothetical protein [Ferruginibacter sp. HRS2-29]MCP9751639.1 hypothetical protein [Ferruginibacter sp. HRS2-29]
MKHIFLLITLFTGYSAIAQEDTVKIDFQRALFHDKILKEQKLTDKADGKLDGILHASANDEVNLQLTDVLFRRIDVLRFWVEKNKDITSNNEKVRYLGYIEDLVRYFRVAWKTRQINPLEFPELVNNFDQVMKANLEGRSILPYISDAPYEVAKINATIFIANKENQEAQNIVYLKFCHLHPDKILETIRPFAKESFADSLIVIASKENPVQLYSYAQNKNSVEGKLIHRNVNPMVVAVTKLSQTSNALFYFPFLDDILSGKQKIEDIQQLIGDGEKGYDSIGYYRLLVKTETEYFKRLSAPIPDTPIAMFGANGLHDMLKRKALEHFVTPINTLHDLSNINIRMKAIDPLTPEELYYMIVMGENDIYTSSYKHSFNRMVQRMGAKPRGDSLLLNVNFDYFKKFIKMAANYNKLDTFLGMMPSQNSESLMRAFVANLDKGDNLEDAVDVADSYSSITNKKLQAVILNYVKENESRSITENNARGKVIYGLLKTIFLSADSSNKVDLTQAFGIPSIYEVANKDMQDDKGRIVQQVFFYGDEDGKAYFPPFVNSFPAKDWVVTSKKEWVEIKSKKGNVFVFANKPLNYNENLDDSAQVHLANYLRTLDMKPSVVVHRGHSYWLKGTIDRMPGDAKIVVLGSCGGYQNLSEILEISPDAHIISTKEIGAGDINRPILNYLNQSFLSGDKLSWKAMWSSLGKLFSSDPSRMIRESWEDYIPPYKNLGAIFIKAYHKQMDM